MVGPYWVTDDRASDGIALLYAVIPANYIHIQYIYTYSVQYCIVYMYCIPVHHLPVILDSPSVWNTFPKDLIFLSWFKNLFWALKLKIFLNVRQTYFLQTSQKTKCYSVSKYSTAYCHWKHFPLHIMIYIRKVLYEDVINKEHREKGTDAPSIQIFCCPE